MIFWIICVLLTLVVAGLIAGPLIRGEHGQAVDPDVAFYRAQLAELDRDLDRAMIEPAEAERARVEVQRRLLAADARSGDVGRSAPAPVVAGVVAVGLLIAALGAYWQLGAPSYPDLPLKARLAASDEVRAARPTQVAMQMAAGPQVVPDFPSDYLDSVATLRAIVPTRPDDLAGWELLAYHEAQMRDFPAAVVAQSRVIAIKGDGADVSDRRILVDAMVTAAEGLISPEAEVAVREILAADPQDEAGRYYLGALYYQTDRADVAFRLWEPLVAAGDTTSYYAAAARAQIEDAAFRAGVRYTLPAERGPSAQDIANASDMSEADRAQMIQGMVSQLSARLADEGGPASDWARLIGAFGVLGETARASEIWLEASEVFAGSEAAMVELRAAADAAGVLQ